MIGILVGVLFGIGWGLAGSAALAPGRRAVAAGAFVGVGLLIGATAVFTRAPGWRPTHAFEPNAYLLAVGAEAVLIALAVAGLRRSGRAWAVMPTCAIIVALHFLGLWRATGSTAFAGLSGALLAPPGVALWQARGRPRVAQAITGLGSGAVLLAAAATGLMT